MGEKCSRAREPATWHMLDTHGGSRGWWWGLEPNLPQAMAHSCKSHCRQVKIKVKPVCPTQGATADMRHKPVHELKESKQKP